MAEIKVSYGFDAAQIQGVVSKGLLAGLTLGQIFTIIVQYGIPVLEQILALMSANPTIAAIDAILQVLGGLFPHPPIPAPSPTPAPPTPTPAP